MNPQFFINLNDPDPYDEETQCPVIISLMQRQTKRKSERAIGFKVYRCDQQTRRIDERFMASNNAVRQLIFRPIFKIKAVNTETYF